MGLMSNAPAYVALLAEAQVDAGVRHGRAAARQSRLEMVVQTFAGTAALLRARGNDTLAVRREVTSPGGSTARGLAALERAGVRAAFQDSRSMPCWECGLLMSTMFGEHRAPRSSGFISER